MTCGIYVSLALYQQLKKVKQVCKLLTHSENMHTSEYVFLIFYT